MQVVERDEHRLGRGGLAEPAQGAVEARGLAAGARQLGDVLDRVAAERDDRLAEQAERQAALHRAGERLGDREAARGGERRGPAEHRRLADPGGAEQRDGRALTASRSPQGLADGAFGVDPLE